MKKKLLWVSDINLNTGFGQVADNVLPELVKTNKYDIACMGINYRGDRHGYNGVHVYPCDSSDPYGFGVFPHVVMKERPDVIFVLQDLFVIMKYVDFLKQHAPQIPTVFYFPIDGDSLPQPWLDSINYATVPVAYSNYGIDIVSRYAPELRDKIRMVYHGIDTEVFKPLPDEERKIMKKNNHCDDKFVIGVVNRYQPRKLIPLTLRAFSLMKNGYKKCGDCGNYYLASLDKCDLNGCTNYTSQVVGKDDLFLYLHLNPMEKMMGWDNCTLHMSARAAGLDPQAKDIMTPGVDVYGPAAPDKHAMNQIYNMFDCYVASDCGEGFGLTQMEALACGLDVVKTSSTTGQELIGEHGYLTKSAGFFSMAYDSGHYRPVAHVPSIVDTLEILYKKWVEAGRYISLSKEKHEYVKREFNWKDKAKGLEQAISDAITFKAQPEGKVFKIYNV